MTVVFNWLGGLFVLLAAGVAILLSKVFGRDSASDAIGMINGGLVALSADLIYRFLYHQEEPWRFVKPTTGGHICFAPVWVFGAVLLLIGSEEVILRGNRHERFLRETVVLVEETTERLRGVEEAVDEEVRSRVEHCQRQLGELAARLRVLSEPEQRRLDRTHGERLATAVREFRLQQQRLNLLAD